MVNTRVSIYVKFGFKISAFLHTLKDAFRGVWTRLWATSALIGVTNDGSNDVQRTILKIKKSFFRLTMSGYITPLQNMPSSLEKEQIKAQI